MISAIILALLQEIILNAELYLKAEHNYYPQIGTICPSFIPVKIQDFLINVEKLWKHE